MHPFTYDYYKTIFANIPKPFAFVDLELFDQNIADIKKRAGGKNIRVASKSVRCFALLERLLKHEQIEGIMAFTAREAVFLSQKGVNDILIAYPAWQRSDIDLVIAEVKKGKRIYLMADSKAHLQHLNEIAEAHEVPLSICLDLDMSIKFPALYFGVYRSSVNSPKKAKKFFQHIKKMPFLRLKAIMGYEAQIAGLGDQLKGDRIKSRVIQLLKKRSITAIEERRAEVVNLALDMGFSLEVVNGGGTGSLETTREEIEVTEVTVGSGFYAPTLFDQYNHFQHLPATAYAIEIVRQPQKGIYTCAGGGYTASGTPGWDKAPQPYLPDKCQLIPNEGSGEVQTPIIYKGSEKLKLGDPIFLRHSKAGELCERFNRLYLVEKGKIVGEVPTYRGEGACFL